MGKFSINKTGETTKRFLEVFSEKDIQIVLDAYHDMQNIIKPSRLPNSPTKYLCSIARTLKKIEKSGWIGQRERIKAMTFVAETVEGAKGGISETNRFYKRVLNGKKPGSPKKHALEIVCSSLYLMVRATFGECNPDHLKAIARFLHEQKIHSRSYYEYLKKNRRQNSFDDTICMIHAIGNVREHPSICDLYDPVTGLLTGPHRYAALIACLLKYKRLFTKNSAQPSKSKPRKATSSNVSVPRAILNNAI